MIKKSAVKRNGRVRVTFEIPVAIADCVELAGEFSDWKPVAMRRRKNGMWKAALELDPLRAYEFKYVVDGSDWVNDPVADRYAPNAFGGENSVAIT